MENHQQVSPLLHEQVIVVGAGPAGLATAYCLQQRGVESLILERAEVPGFSWYNHYERLHLHTVRWLSHLPGLRFPRRYGQWISRQQVVSYLSRYAGMLNARFAFDTRVESVRQTPDGWLISTSRGKFLADQLVMATGLNHEPVLPAWQGLSRYRHSWLHASTYRNAGPYQGCFVLVVGMGNTGAEIALDLVEGGAARVALAIRHPPNIVPRSAFGIPVQLSGIFARLLPLRVGDALVRLVQRLTLGDLSSFGLPRPEQGVMTQMVHHQRTPTIDLGTLAELRSGRIEITAGVSDFEEEAVLLTDGRRLQPDVVILATGYASGLASLLSQPGILDAREMPLTPGGRSSREQPGLYFVGFQNVVSGNLREISREAQRAARNIASSLAEHRRRAPAVRTALAENVLARSPHGLAFRRSGQGEPLLLLHGAGTSHHIWDPVFYQLIRQREVLVLDLPGAGASPELEFTTAPALLASVLQFLDDLDRPQVHVVGNSLGGWLALKLAARGRARSVLALAPLCFASPGRQRGMAAILKLSQTTARGLRPVASPVSRSGMMRTVLLSLYAGRAGQYPSLAARQALLDLADMTSMSAMLQAALDDPLSVAEVSAITCPVTFGWGTRDPFPGSASRQEAARLFPLATSIQLTGCGHVPTWDDPDAVAQLILTGSTSGSVQTPLSESQVVR